VLAILAALTLVACTSGEAAPKALKWTEKSPGISHAMLELSGDDAFAGHAFAIDLTKTHVRLFSAAQRQTVDVMAAALLPAAAGAHVAVNASFFDETGKAMGRAVDDGTVLSGDRRAPWGALVITNGVARIVKGEALPAEGAGGDLVVQGLPRLVVAGEVPKLKPASAERTAVCADGAVLVIVVTTSPVDTTAFARFLAKPRDKGGLGCKDALNLDGGPSTQLHARVGTFALDVKGGWGVPNALVVLPR
jgi:uncharacterized protein YigE (DUF2233 family)